MSIASAIFNDVALRLLKSSGSKIGACLFKTKSETEGRKRRQRSFVSPRETFLFTPGTVFVGKENREPRLCGCASLSGGASYSATRKHGEYAFHSADEVSRRKSKARRRHRAVPGLQLLSFGSLMLSLSAVRLQLYPVRLQRAQCHILTSGCLQKRKSWCHVEQILKRS